MKLSGKQLTTAVLIGLMGISAGGVAMAKPPIMQPPAVSTPSGGQQDPHSNPQGTQPPAGGQGQQDPAKTTDELIAEIQTNLTNQGKELDKKATKDELEKYATKDEMNDALSKKADASEVTALAAQLAQKANQSDVERDYAKKTDLDAKATKDELKNYAKTADLDGKYILKTDLQTEVNNLTANSQTAKEAAVETKRQGNLAETAATKAEDAAKKAEAAAAAYNIVAQSQAFQNAAELSNKIKNLDQKADKSDLAQYTKTEDLNKQLQDKADKSDLAQYTKTEDLNKQLQDKADKTDLSQYTKTEDLNKQLQDKADKTDLAQYTKTEDLNKQLQDKADKTDLAQYTKTEDLNKQLQDKADKTDLADYVRKSDLKIGNNAKDIQKVGARAAALAGLHPLEFDPSTKLSFAVSSGSYDGENSVAFGAFYRPTKNVMLSAASTMGSKNAYTFGMSFKFGKSSATTTTNTPDVQELYRVVGQLQYQVAAQQQEIQQLRQAAKKTK